MNEHKRIDSEPYGVRTIDQPEPANCVLLPTSERVGCPVHLINDGASELARAQRRGERDLVQPLIMPAGGELRLADLVARFHMGDLVPAQAAHHDQVRRLWRPPFFARSLGTVAAQAGRALRLGVARDAIRIRDLDGDHFGAGGRPPEAFGKRITAEIAQSRELIRSVKINAD